MQLPCCWSRAVLTIHARSYFANFATELRLPACMSSQARKLEGELDVKLAAYAKLCSGFEANYRLKASDSSSLGADQVCEFGRNCLVQFTSPVYELAA